MMVTRRIASFCFLSCLLLPIDVLPNAQSHAQGLSWGTHFPFAYVNNVFTESGDWSNLGDVLKFKVTIEVTNMNAQSPDEHTWVRLRCEEGQGSDLSWHEKKLVWASGQAPLSNVHNFSTGFHEKTTDTWECYQFLFEWGTGEVVGVNRTDYFIMSFCYP